jgi:hypothetical protein
MNAINNKDDNEFNQKYDPITHLLLNEHRSLINSIFPFRMVNRLLTVCILFFLIYYDHISIYAFFAIFIAVLIIEIYWFSMEKNTKYSINKLEELIVESMETFYKSKWTRVYINWRNVKWSLSKPIKFHTREPIYWLFLISLILLLKIFNIYI